MCTVKVRVSNPDQAPEFKTTKGLTTQAPKGGNPLAITTTSIPSSHKAPGSIRVPGLG